MDLFFFFERRYGEMVEDEGDSWRRLLKSLGKEKAKRKTQTGGKDRKGGGGTQEKRGTVTEEIIEGI